MARITLAVSSSISAYKSLDLLSILQKQGHEVAPILSKTARRWISPKLFKALLVNQTKFTTLGIREKMPHIALAKESDLILYAPATANTLCNLAQGSASDLLSTLFLVARCPIIVCPAMNPLMWTHPNVQKNARILLDLGVHLCGPTAGATACQDWGIGKLISVEDIVEKVSTVLTLQKDKKFLTDFPILISSGGSQESIDPVRVLSNVSSRTMGSLLAIQALQLGANVTYVEGNGTAITPAGARVISFKTNVQLQKILQEELFHHKILIMNAAPCDWKIKNSSTSKISSNDALTLHLEKLPDILSSLKKRTDQIFVGFALENTLELTETVQKKLKRKQLDLLIINKIDSIGSSMTNIRIINALGVCVWENTEPITKQQAAKQIFIAIENTITNSVPK